MSILAAEGSGDDWGEVVDLHEASLRRVIGSRTRDPGLVDDILQDTYLRALRAGRHPLRAKVSDEGWLRMLARRASVDAYRGARRRHPPVDHLSLVAEEATADTTSTPGSDEHLDAMASRDAVRWAFRRLSPRQQRLLVLRGVEQLTYQQMAALEHTTVEAMASALNRARERLRAEMDGYRQGETRSFPAVVLLGIDMARRLRDRLGRMHAVVSPHLFELAGATVAVGIAAAWSMPASTASTVVPEPSATALVTGAASFDAAHLVGGREAVVARTIFPASPRGDAGTHDPGNRTASPLVAARPDVALTPGRSWMRITVDVAAGGGNRTEASIEWKCTNSTLGEPVCQALDVLPNSERRPDR